jgi:DNA-binding protein HU-beta
VNKADLIEGLRQRKGLSRRQATLIVDTLFDAVVEALGKGEDVQLSRFGTFYLKERAAREGRNPRTQEKITVPAATTIGFRPSQQLKAEVSKVDPGE